MQVFQECVAQTKRAAAVQINALKACIERVVVRRSKGGVQFGDKPLLDAVEPLVFTGFGKLDIREDAFLTVSEESIVALDIRVVFVPLRNQADNLRLKRARFEILEYADALVAFRNIILPKILIHADRVADAALQVRFAKADPFIRKLRVRAEQRHKVVRKRVGAACLIGADDSVERNAAHRLIDDGKHAVFFASCVENGQ